MSRPPIARPDTDDFPALKDGINWHCANHENAANCTKDCAFQAALALFSKKLTLPIMKSLLERQKLRFNEIQRILAASPKTITHRLNELVHCGLIVRTAFNEIPMRVEYSPTIAAMGLKDIFQSISQWAQQWTRSTARK